MLEVRISYTIYLINTGRQKIIDQCNILMTLAFRLEKFIRLILKNGENPYNFTDPQHYDSKSFIQPKLTNITPNGCVNLCTTIYRVL